MGIHINDRKTILLVEDEAILAMSEKRLIEDAGYDFSHVFCGEDAVDFLKKDPAGAQLVLMDINLGRGIDGTQAAQQILEFLDIPIVFWSSHTEKSIVEKTEGITSYGYIVKNSGHTVLEVSIKMAFRLFEAKQKEKSKEIALQKNEHRLQQIIDAAPYAAFEYELMDNGDLVFTGANKSADKILGVDCSRFIGMTIEQAFPALEQTPIPEAYKNAAKFGTSYESENVTYDENEIEGAFEIHAFQTRQNKMAVFFRDITERKKAEDKLKIFRGSLENASNAVGMSTPEGRHYYQNRAFTELFGDIGEDPPDTLYVDKELGREVFKTIMQGNRWKGEVKMYSREGKILDILLSAYANRNQDGKITSLVGVHTDITEYRNALLKLDQQYKEKEILLKEVHHRIKNNIAAIGGLLELQSEATSNEEAKTVLTEAIGRVENIRLIYEKLLQKENYDTISVKMYLEDLVAAISGLSPNKQINIQTRIDDFELVPELLFPLGTIINELITNAIKYAFTDLDSGTVQVTLNRMKKAVLLTVKDNGKGLPEGLNAEKSEGLGLMLVRMLSQQLQGSFSIENANGVECKIQFDL